MAIREVHAETPAGHFRTEKNALLNPNTLQRPIAAAHETAVILAAQGARVESFLAEYAASYCVPHWNRRRDGAPVKDRAKATLS